MTSLLAHAFPLKVNRLLAFVKKTNFFGTIPSHSFWIPPRIASIVTDDAGESWVNITDGQFQVVFESDLIEPNPFPKGYQ